MVMEYGIYQGCNRGGDQPKGVTFWQNPNFWTEKIGKVPNFGVAGDLILENYSIFGGKSWFLAIKSSINK